MSLSSMGTLFLDSETFLDAVQGCASWLQVIEREELKLPSVSLPRGVQAEVQLAEPAPDEMLLALLGIFSVARTLRVHLEGACNSAGPQMTPRDTVCPAVAVESLLR